MRKQKGIVGGGPPIKQARTFVRVPRRVLRQAVILMMRSVIIGGTATNYARRVPIHDTYK